VGNTKNAPGEVTISPIDKFPGGLQRDVKVRAAQKGISFKSFLIQALRYALKNDTIIEGKALVVNSENENGKKPVRRSPPPDAPQASAENVHNKRREEKRRKT
jgi:hypothetical protein